MSVGGVPVGVGGTGKTLAVLVERSSSRAVLAGLGVGVPDLVLSASNAFDSVIVGEVSGAVTFSSIWAVD